MHYRQILRCFTGLSKCSYLYLDVKDTCTWFLQALKLLQGLVTVWASSSGDQNLVTVFVWFFFFHKLLGCTARNYFSKYSQLWNQRLCTPTDQHWPDVKLGSCPFPQLVKELFFFFFLTRRKWVLSALLLCGQMWEEFILCFDYWWLPIDLKVIVLEINDQHVVVFNLFDSLSVGMNKQSWRPIE